MFRRAGESTTASTNKFPAPVRIVVPIHNRIPPACDDCTELLAATVEVIRAEDRLFQAIREMLTDGILKHETSQVAWMELHKSLGIVTASTAVLDSRVD